MLILIGTDDALLEGLSQLLAGAGHAVRAVHSLEEAEDIDGGAPPLLVVADRRAVAGDAGERLSRLTLAPGGAFVLYRSAGDQEANTALPHSIARLTLAELSLPLERQRLAALAQYVKTRARESGRVRFDTPPAQRAP